MQRTLQMEGYLVASVNAWVDDHADDPILSVMSAIDAAVAPIANKSEPVKRSLKTLKTTTQKVAIAAAKGAATQLARRLIGDAATEIAAELGVGDNKVVKGATEAAQAQTQTLIDSKAKSMLDSFNETKRSIEAFKKQLSELLQKTHTDDGEHRPLFVLVDELDRCRPPYAIALLERIKHLFDIDNVVFVVATDTKQLGHAIGAVYGGGFNSTRYLGRFFNRTYYFEEVERRQFVDNLLQQEPLEASRISLPPSTDLKTYLGGAFDFFALPLRDIEQAYDILRSVVTAWDSRLKIEMAILLPIVVAHQQKVELVLDSGFAAILNGIAKMHGGSRSPWPIKFTNHERYPPQAQPTDGIKLATDFIAHAAKPLPDLNHEVSAMHSRWVVQRLAEEFAVLYSNTHRPSDPPYSIIRHYPEMVRSAGRLLPERLK